MTRPDYLLDIPSTDYHEATKRNEFTTSHRLNLFRKCPALYHKHVTGEIVEGDTDSFMLGRATHTFILEGKDKFDAEYTVSDGPVNEKTGKPFGRATKAYQEWAAEQTKPVIGSEDFAPIEKMSAAVHAHAHAADILSSGIAEGTVRTKWKGEPVQSRLDWFDPERGILADVKSASDVDRFPFDIRDFGYVQQLAFYSEVLKLAGFEGRLRCYLIAVEKKEPFRVAVVELSPLTINEGNYALPGSRGGAGNDPCIEELQKCRAEDTWPTRYEDVIVM